MATDHLAPTTEHRTAEGRVAAADRGSTVIADRVVAKIAAQAAREALDGVPAAGGTPHAMVTVHQDSARVRISLELDYPSDIGRQCGAVRRRVAERVETLAGMDVPDVAVLVERLHSAHTRGATLGRLA
ncbi:Asp23/Gls24 family envelope stress response protein [Streptomyces sp. NPDC020965]|uniref:Asp23/Gls24 family envelope stress response protein n=1 Tax=Streptomyces sp. NPDC020965 TaxID=3365105 RepID=UPI0037B3EA59